jgi:hypothetical protein
MFSIADSGKSTDLDYWTVRFRRLHGGGVIARSDWRHRRLACRFGMTGRMPVPPVILYGAHGDAPFLDSRFHENDGRLLRSTRNDSLSPHLIE